MVKKNLFADDKFLKFFSCSYKNVQSNRIYMSVGIVGISRVQARQCTNTPSLQNGCIFELWDAWRHVHMLLGADMINIFH